MFYLSLIAYLLCVFICLYQNKLKNWVVLLGVMLVGYIGLRYNTGVDKEAYNEMYNLASMGLLSPLPSFNLGGFQIFGSDQALGSMNIEPGYWLINFLAYKLNGGMILVNLICSIIFVVGYIKFLKQLPSFVVGLVASTFIVFFMSVHFTRFVVALSLVLWGISYLLKGNDKKFFIFVLLAMLFHYPAVMMLFLVKINSSPNSFYRTVWFRWSIAVILALLSVYILAKLALYFTLWGNDYKYPTFDLLYVAYSLVCVVLFYIYRKAIQSQNLMVFKLLKLACLAFVAVCVLIYPTKGLLASRILYYFDFIQPLVLTSLYQILSVEKRRNFLVVVIGAYAIQLSWIFISLPEVPYDNVFLQWFK